MRRPLQHVAWFTVLVLAPSLPAQVFDEISLADGSRIIGKVVAMGEGRLTIDTAFSGAISLPWKEIISLKTVEPHDFLLKDGTTIRGTAEPLKEGSLQLRSEKIAEPVTVTYDSVDGIDPPPKVRYRGNFNIGLSLSDGNTRDRTASLLGDFEARAERMRLTLRGAYNYGETKERLSVRNGKGEIKFDFFVYKGLYLFTSALFEHDTFQDLTLRTALAAGPGIQIIDKGTFAETYLKEMQLYAESGIAYFDEDYKTADDRSYVAGRWAVRFDWPVLPKKIAIFHYHQGFPSLETARNIYITTEQGVRFNIFDNFVASLQVNWRWNNVPSSGLRRADTLFLFTLGYTFDA